MLALASAEFDIGAVEEGQTITVKWRGKPVFIRHRTGAEIAESEAVALDDLRDPQTDAERVDQAQWLIVMGIVATMLLALALLLLAQLLFLRLWRLFELPPVLPQGAK